MNKIIEAHAAYEAIVNTYNGTATNWQDILDKLENLKVKVQLIKVRAGKNTQFMSWAKTKLIQTINTEIIVAERNTNIAKRFIMPIAKP